VYPTQVIIKSINISNMVYTYSIVGSETSNGLSSNFTQEAMRKKIAVLEEEVHSFGKKRAYFMDIYKRKEGLYFDWPSLAEMTPTAELLFNAREFCLNWPITCQQLLRCDNLRWSVKPAILSHVFKSYSSYWLLCVTVNGLYTTMGLIIACVRKGE